MSRDECRAHRSRIKFSGRAIKCALAAAQTSKNAGRGGKSPVPALDNLGAPSTRQEIDHDDSTIDEDKLNDLLGRVVVDFGAVSIAPLVLIGDQLGLYRALASQGPMTSAELAAHTETHERYVREWLNAQAASGYVAITPTAAATSSPPSRRSRSREEDSPAFMIGAFQTALAAGRILRQADRGVSHRRGHRLARARSRALSRHRALLSIGLHRQSHADLDSGHRRDGGQAALGRARGGHRMRPWRVDDPDGASLSRVAVRWLRLPRRIDRRRERARAPGGCRRALPLRSRKRQGFPGPQLRFRDGVRRAARHGRSGRRVAARAHDARAGRDAG